MMMNHLIRSGVRCLRPGQPAAAAARWSSSSSSTSSSAAPPPPPPTDMQQALGDMVRKDKVVVFIKGTPAQPMCGFSNAVVQILRMHGVDQYAAYNVLDDQDLRQGIKEFSNWPTIPQVYINSEFLGGCDILLQMHQNGDLVEELSKLGIRSALLDAQKESK